MNYTDGQAMEPGDIVQIEGRFRGRVIACMDTGRYLPGEESWEYLIDGVMIDTDFGGLVHYGSETFEPGEIVLIHRAE